MEPIRAERETVTFIDGLIVDGYRMPNGEFRVGLEGASLVVGYAENWLSRLTKKEGRTLKSLRGFGFTAYQLEVSVSREEVSGASIAKTISLDDFNLVILYAASKGKKAALALQLSLTKLALNDFFRDAFGETPLSIDEKRQLFYETYASTISPENWRGMDRAEIINLALAGDEPQLRWGFWNR